MSDRPRPPRPTAPATDDTAARDTAARNGTAVHNGIAVYNGVAADDDDSVVAESPPAAKLTKAARLEARAARLREAEERRAAERRAAAPQPRSGRGLLIATVALAVLSAGLVVVLVIGYFSWQHQRDLASARAGALKAAKSFALDFGAYDYRTLDADFKKVTKGMTADFAKDYTDTSTKLKPTLVQYKTRVTSSIQGAGVTFAGTSKATVVVFLDQTVNTAQSNVPRLDRNRLQMQLVRQQGTWLVAKLLAK